ncbi:hypothetical protein BDZ90DRAFT_229547 [Jaminaea rosea]|uniref:Trafficking protein particle complex subunit 11 domain-containing protein n=1 Tax=Jaminaea rosea TaxID=1569628 RepID=A0A316V2X3_9BASI|nr:hypothetical protein BDZ90DRAFT_229547 [Jaminaea rosea]PWN30533.1 hypothetical protein BDZ90DRAFT_229547 [Jaminaea rosea]
MSSSSSGPRGPSSAVQVTYTSTSSFLDTPLCSHILSSITSQLPLRNVHHRPSAPTNAAVKTIQTLPVRLVPLADEQLKAKHKPETRHLVQANLLERPFVHVFLVATADSDAYRSHIRNEIRTWMNELKETPTLNAVPKSSGTQPALPSGAQDDENATAASSSKDKEEETSPEYLIVYVTPPAGASGATGSSGAGYFDRSPSSSSNALPAGTGSPSTPAKDDATTSASSAKTGMGRFLSSSTSSSSKDPTGGVLDKLKTDFGGGKKSERIVHISRLPASSNSHLTQFADPTIFADLLTALRQSVTTTFDLSIKAQREEAVKLKSLRSVRGWNPVSVFGKIECLANTYESIGLHDEALRCFEELDDLYEDCLREGELTWFPSITPTSLSEGEDSTSVLSPTGKPYREMILHSSASLWELKKYLLARRLMLLSKMGRGLAVMREAMAWLAEMRSMVAGQDLPPHCLAAFAISVCLDIVHHCQHLFLSPSGVLTHSLPAATFDDTIKARTTELDRLPASFHSLSGDVLAVALDQVQKMGVGFQYLPAAEPFITAQDEVVKTRETTGVTRPELLKAVEDEESFDTFYTALAERALDAFARGGRNKGRRRLQISLATLDLHRNRVEKAHSSFSTLLESFSERTTATWPSIERLLLRRQLECHAKLGKPKNRAWVASVVQLLRCMPSYGRDGIMAAGQDRGHEEDEWADEATLFSKLRSASMDFEKEVPVSGFSKLSLIAPASSRATLLDEEDGVQLPITIFSSLLTDLQVDDARFCLAGGGQKYQREQYWLTSGGITLKPGRNEVILRSSSSAPGNFVLDVSQIRLGRIVFQYVAPKSAPPPSSSSSMAAATALTPTLVKIPHDGEALDAVLEQPSVIALDQPRNAHLVVRSGRNKVTKATLRVKHIADARPLMGFAAGEADSGSAARVEPTEDELGLELSNVEPWTETTIVFPLDEAPPADGSAMPLLIDIEYHTPSSKASNSAATTKRLFRKRADLHTALPLGVNVQDFFRLDCLMCKFSISTGGGSTLKVKRADLVQQSQHDGAEVGAEESEYSIAGPPQLAEVKRRGASVVVTPRQPVAYVFKISRRPAKKTSKGHVTSSGAPSTSLRLSIVYRTLHEDAKVQVVRILDKRLASESSISRGTSTLLSRSLADFVDEQLDTAAYAATGSIRFYSPDGGTHTRESVLAHWRTSVLSRQWALSPTSTEGKMTLDVLRDVLTSAARCGPLPTSEAPEAAWRTLEIPVEVPQMDIVNSVRVLPATPTPVVVGHPLPVDVHITSTLHWGSRRGASGAAPVDDAASSSSLALPGGSRRRSSTPSSPVTAGGGEADTDAGSVFEDAVSAADGGGSDKTEKEDKHPASRDTTDSKAAVAGAEDKANQQRMHYEIQADFDSWIVSGPRRGVFHLSLSPPNPNTTKKTIAYTSLIPLRSGSLSLPSVAVWPLRAAPLDMPPSLAHGGGRRDDGRDEGQGALPTCETYVENVAERVRIVDAEPSEGEGDEVEWDAGSQVEQTGESFMAKRERRRVSRRETFCIDATALTAA